MKNIEACFNTHFKELENENYKTVRVVSIDMNWT